MREPRTGQRGCTSPRAHALPQGVQQGLGQLVPQGLLEDAPSRQQAGAKGEDLRWVARVGAGDSACNGGGRTGRTAGARSAMRATEARVSLSASLSAAMRARTATQPASPPPSRRLIRAIARAMRRISPPTSILASPRR